MSLLSQAKGSDTLSSTSSSSANHQPNANTLSSSLANLPRQNANSLQSLLNAINSGSTQSLGGVGYNSLTAQKNVETSAKDDNENNRENQLAAIFVEPPEKNAEDDCHPKLSSQDLSPTSQTHKDSYQNIESMVVEESEIIPTNKQTHSSLSSPSSVSSQKTNPENQNSSVSPTEKNHLIDSKSITPQSSEEVTPVPTHFSFDNIDSSPSKKIFLLTSETTSESPSSVPKKIDHLTENRSSLVDLSIDPPELAVISPSEGSLGIEGSTADFAEGRFVSTGADSDANRWLASADAWDPRNIPSTLPKVILTRFHYISKHSST